MAFCWGCPRSRLNIYRHCKMLLQELKWNVKKQVMSVPFLGSFIDFRFRNGSATNFSLLHTGQFRLIFPIDKLLIFSDQHLDLSLMYTDPGILGWSNMTSKPSGMSLPPSWMSSSRASRGTPFSLSRGEFGGVVYFFGMNVFGSFSLWEPTCMRCVHMALWTCNVLGGSFYAQYIFIHSPLQWIFKNMLCKS